jgi:hypothetical protein
MTLAGELGGRAKVLLLRGGMKGRAGNASHLLRILEGAGLARDRGDPTCDAIHLRVLEMSSWESIKSMPPTLEL